MPLPIGVNRGKGSKRRSHETQIRGDGDGDDIAMTKPEKHKWRGYILDKKGNPICLKKDAERERAKFALAVYGNHLPNCPIRPKCACGFLKALGMREPSE